MGRIMSIKNNDELIAQAICEYEKGIVKILLLCVDNLEFGLGINKLVQILKGGQTRFITDFSLQNNIGFSLLKQFSKKDIEYITQKASEISFLRRFLRVYIQVFTGNPLPDCFYNSKIVYMNLPISSITSSACGKTPVAFKYPWPSPLYTTSFVFTFAFESL
jgi:hypothetical protein